MPQSRTQKLKSRTPQKLVQDGVTDVTEDGTTSSSDNAMSLLTDDVSESVTMPVCGTTNNADSDKTPKTSKKTSKMIHKKTNSKNVKFCAVTPTGFNNKSGEPHQPDILFVDQSDINHSFVLSASVKRDVHLALRKPLRNHGGVSPSQSDFLPNVKDRCLNAEQLMVDDSIVHHSFSKEKPTDWNEHNGVGLQRVS